MVDYGGYSGCDDPSFGSICAYNITTLPYLHATTSSSTTTGISATISTGIGATRRTNLCMRQCFIPRLWVLPAAVCQSFGVIHKMKSFVLIKKSCTFKNNIRYVLK